MAVYHGNNGVVKIGSDVVAEVQNWEYNEADVALLELTSMGDTAATYQNSGCVSGEGSVECVLDEDDTAQTAVAAGATASLKLYAEGTAVDDFEYSGTVAVESLSRGTSKDGWPTFKFTFKGKLTRAAVSA